jgi:multidrug resistance efflux pump
VSPDELRAAKLARDRSTEEAAAKAAGVRAARAELHAAETVLAMHEIRSSVRGVIKTIRKHRGEAVKSLETVFVIRIVEAAAKPAPPDKEDGGERQEVPAGRDGQLVFLGTEIKPGERVPPEKVIKAEVGFLAIEIGLAEKVPPAERLVFRDHPGKEYRRARPGDDHKPDKCVVARETKAYRKLEVGDRVEEGQLLALVDPVLALDELAVKIAKLDAAEAERRASEKTRDEYRKRWENMRDGSRRTPGAFAQDDIRAAELQYQRYLEEEIHKAAVVRQAQRELSAALTVLRMHEVRSSLRGVVRRIDKHRGEAVKNLEPVLLIEGGK